MKKKVNVVRNFDQKSVSIGFLFAITIAIMLLGLFFIIFSIRNNISFPVLNTTIHGSLFGATVLYLGLRYFFLVKKLKNEIYKSNSVFLWGNFKKVKNEKNR